MNKKLFSYLLLGLIIFTAGFLRFYQLDHSDVINDEAIIGFRSIGYIDFFSSPYQTTPWEWFSDVPAWARLSFHDHPPLTFVLQHISFKLFGQNLFALRLPFALAGVASVVLLYLIAKNLYGKKSGIIAALLLAVSSYHVWVSRTGLQEALVIFFILLTLFLFLKALENGQHWWWGISLGLAMLTKYTTFILPLGFICYLFFFKRSVLVNKKFWLAICLAALIFSPVIFYNIKMYQTVGHFDLQFSYLFGQQVAEWQSLPGKEQMGDFIDRLKNIIPAIYQGFLWPMFFMLIASFGFLGLKIFKSRVDNDAKKNWLPVIAIIFYLLFFLLIGPSKRFVVILVPFVILLIAWFIGSLPRAARIILLIILIPLEIFFSCNTLLAYNPIGTRGLTYSYLDIENYNWGYNQLDSYLSNILADKKPAFSLETKYPFLETIRKKSLNEAKNKSELAALIVYDPNFYDLATFWTFHRRLVYASWPIVSADVYLQQGKDFWQSQGISDVYFFKIKDPLILSQSVTVFSTAAEELANSFDSIQPDIIKRPDGREVFEVYHWQF
ncbi:MAG: glycosyltransferase family 39 protein [Candidatus Buchananbacteria bacterium]|nr:glycosyltransferase family 39 protein [Candidatus Buchananbacteria bacterium]